jgi:transposase-like protein
MYLHANAKLGLAGRFALVRAIDGGVSLKAAAAAFSVSPATAHRWWHRWLDGDRQSPRCSTVRAGRSARRGCFRLTCRSGFAIVAALPPGPARTNVKARESSSRSSIR